MLSNSEPPGKGTWHWRVSQYAAIVTHRPGLFCFLCARPGLLPMCPVRTSVPIHPLSPTTPSSTTCPPLRGGLMVLSCPISLTWGEVASNLTAGGFFFPSGRIS